MPSMAVRFRRFTSLNTRIRLREGQITASLSDLLEGAPEPVIVDYQKMMRIFNRHEPDARNGNRVASRGKKPLSIPAVKVLICTNPDGAVGVGNDILRLQFRNSLLRA